MNFKFKKQRSFFVEGVSSKGNQIYFVPCTDNVHPSKEIVLYCTFDITTKMTDLINNSNIVEVNSFSNKSKQIKVCTKSGFNLNRFKKILGDMTITFDL